MKAGFLTLIFLFSLNYIKAQSTHFDLGEDYYRKRFYLEAIQEYQLALKEEIVFNKYKMTDRIANTYKMLFDYENAVIWFKKLLDFKDENTTANLLSYAQILMNLEKYEEAKSIFTLYANRMNQPQWAEKYAAHCDWALQHNNTFQRYHVSKTSIETGSRSMGISFYKKGLMFSQAQIQDFKTKTAFYDLAYAACNDTTHFSLPELLKGTMNHGFYEGTPFVTADEKTIYYSGNASEATKYRERKTDKLHLSKEGVNILKIYSVEQTNNEWSTIKELPFNSNQYDCVFPHLTNNGKTLYFASNKPGGLGGYDLYKSELNAQNQWGEPVNLGPQINSELDEMYPFVFNDSLFFSSKGREGYGGADIYVSAIQNKGYTKANNLGKPFNSSKDDFSYIVKTENGLRKGYFSSNREGTHGYDYIYYFGQIPNKIYPDTIRGIALNKITLIPLKDVKVTLVKNTQVVKDAVTDETGAIELILDKKTPYTVTFEAKGFQPKTIEIPAENREDVIAKFGDLKLEPVIEKNSIIKIPNIYFDYDKATIRTESFKVLEQIILFLNENPTLKVELSAHTDSRGSDVYNSKLSQRRAESTVKYLTEKGIDPTRLVPKGYGETKLQNQCKNGVKCTEAEHEFNRRVEMKVL